MTNSHQKIWIGIEGIGGAGKTTQLTLLKASLFKIFPESNIYYAEEFSNNIIGNYLNSNILENGFRIKKTNKRNNIVNHLLVISDKLHIIRELLNNETLDVIIFDRFILSDIAHALTDGKITSISSEYNILKKAFNSIYHEFFFSTPSQLLHYIFLDCPIDIACHRLEKRNKIITKDIHKNFLYALRQNYKQLLLDYSNVSNINADQDANIINSELNDIIINTIKDKIN